MADLLKQVYFAGKVDNYRAKLFSSERIMEQGIGVTVTAVNGGQCGYGGPHAFMRSKVAPDHSWGSQPHGIVGCSAVLENDTLLQLERAGDPVASLINENDRREYEHWAGWEIPVSALADTISDEGSGGLTASGAVQRCFQQIDWADAVHAYIDSLDCPGTLAELGYASANGKPIYLTISSSLGPAKVRAQWSQASEPGKELWDGHFGHTGVPGYPMSIADSWTPDHEWVGSDSTGKQLFRCATWQLGEQLNRHKEFVSSASTVCDYGFIRRLEPPVSGGGSSPDELWFIKNLPGVKHWQYGSATDICADLLVFPPAPEPAKPSKVPAVSAKMRLEVLVRDGYRCQYCGAAAADGATLEIDHIVPRARGGENLMWNLQTLCFDCNRGKRDKILPPAPAA